MSPARAPVASGVPASLDVGALFRAHAPFLLRTVERLAGSGAPVEEIVQDTFVLAHRHSAVLGTHPAPRAWLYITARNLVLHHKRGFARRARMHEGVRDAPPSTPAPSPEDLHARREHALRIRACVATLPIDKREVFVLFELEGLSGVEVASLVGVPIGTVWTRLSDARARFKAAWLAQHEGEAP